MLERYVHVKYSKNAFYTHRPCLATVVTATTTVMSARMAGMLAFFGEYNIFSSVNVETHRTCCENVQRHWSCCTTGHKSECCYPVHSWVREAIVLKIYKYNASKDE